MAFVVEDGTGLEDANSLCSVEFADSYFADRGVEKWGNTDEDKKQFALIRATDYIETRFRFAGAPVVGDQALGWPRTLWAVVPVAVRKATAEYALRALDAALAPDPVTSVSLTGGEITESTVKIGPITETTKYSSSSAAISSAVIKAYPSADMLLRPYFAWGSGTIRN